MRNIGQRHIVLKSIMVDLLSLGLLAIYCASAIINGQPVSFVCLQNVLPYLLFFLIVRFVFVSLGDYMIPVSLLVVCIWSCRESIKGLMQAFGHATSGHTLFAMTGSFANPGPYGGFIAVTTAIATAYIVKNRTAGIRQLCLPALTVFLGLTVMPASMSRAAWLSYALAVFACIFRETGLKNWIRRRKIMTGCCVILFVLLSAGAFIMKKDSGIGRIHIWNMELRAIADVPLAGNGPGTALGAYGEAQEKYFRKEERSETVKRVAGCPEYTFNEFLKAGIETGIIGMVLLMVLVIAALVVLIDNRNVFGYGLMAMAIFAFFSYPLSIPALTLLSAGLVAMAADKHPTEIVISRKVGNAAGFSVIVPVLVLTILCLPQYISRKESTDRWKTARQWASMELYDDALTEYEEIYPIMRWNYRYLYDYGHALHKTGKHLLSNEILREGAMISSDPMFHNIIGKNYQAIGQYGEAEKAYMKSHYMVPCRIYPLVLLMEMYMETGEYEKAMETGNQILGMPVNPKNRAMVGLRKEVEDKMETYEAMR